MVGRILGARNGDVADGADEIGGGILAEISGAQAALAGEGAAVGIELAVEHFKQRGFALTVAAVEADAFVALDAQGDVGQDGGAAKGDGGVAEFDQGHSTKKESARSGRL